MCPWLRELIETAKAQGAVTMLVTNGTELTAEKLAAYTASLDWLTLSIDSADPGTHLALGRAVGNKTIPTQRYLELAKCARERGMQLKINTVVTRLNAQEDLGPLIAELRPSRWKILRALPISGQNDGSIEFAVLMQARYDDRMRPAGIIFALDLRRSRSTARSGRGATGCCRLAA